MVQRLVRLHLGYTAQSGPLCERKTNVGGGKERGALEGDVATNESSPVIEDLSWAKTICFVLCCLGFFFLFVYVPNVNFALAQPRSIWSGKQQPW